MKYITHIVVLLSLFGIAGCGGGGSPEVNEQSASDTPKIYQNKKLPTLSENALPDILISKQGSSSGKQIKQLKISGETSSGLKQLKQRANFFYREQLEMNIGLGHIDSVWSQIEEYCGEKIVCVVPKGKIVFEYTKGLYLRDRSLIENFEEKTGTVYYDYHTGLHKEDLERIIGYKIPLESVKLRIDEDAEYKYEIVIVQSVGDDMRPAFERSIARWSEDHKDFFVRSEMLAPDTAWTQYVYSEKDTGKYNKFTSNHSGDYYMSLELIEKEDGIRFVVDEPDDDNMDMSFFAEGYLYEDGGKITLISDSTTLYESFDLEGNLFTRIYCQDVVEDIHSVLLDGWCQVEDPSLIKSIIQKNVYSLGLEFLNDDDILPTSMPRSQSAIKFEENNTLYAVVDCSVFTADYSVADNGAISFSNIVRTVSDDLRCIYPSVADNFEVFLNKDYPFGNGSYDAAYRFWPTFEERVDIATFNMQEFENSLRNLKFVDSPLMNSVFSSGVATQLLNLQTDRWFLLSVNPIISINNEEITIEILDANFTATMEVVNPRHVRFTNISRINKDNVVYPEDTDNNNCTQESEDRCMDDLSVDGNYSDRVFADIIEAFLHEEVEVFATTTSYSSVIFKGTKLSFWWSHYE